MEHLMGEYSVENLLFLTEVAFMKQKFTDSPLTSNTRDRDESRSKSVASSIKNAFQSLSERRTSAESTSSKGTPPPRVSTTSRKSTRLGRLKTIDSSQAIISSQLE